MIVLNVTYKCKPDKRDDFLAQIIAEGIDVACRADEGCVKYDYYFPADGSDELLLLEKWEERRRRSLAAKRQSEDPWVRLARAEVEAWVNGRRRIDPPEDLPAALYADRAGVFVSLHKEGRLRGCIGTIAPTQPCVAEEIIANAISAASRDPRFSPVRKDELGALEISVDVLAPAEKIRSTEELDVRRYGVIVTKGRKRGLLLPNLDGVDTVEQQVAIALQKSGLSAREKNYELERFEVVRHV